MAQPDLRAVFDTEKFRILQRPALPTLQSEFSCACNLLCAEISAEIACVVSERMGLSLSVGNLH